MMTDQASKTLNFEIEREFWFVSDQLRQQLLVLCDELSVACIPFRVQRLRTSVNTPITIKTEHYERRELPLCFAIKAHNTAYVLDLLRCGADIYAVGPDGRCAIDVLNSEIAKQSGRKFSDLRLSNIKKAMDANVFWLDTVRYQLIAIIAAPFIAVALVYIGHFQFFQVYLNTFIIFLRDYAPILNASWSASQFYKQAIKQYDDAQALKKQRATIANLSSNIIHVHQKQIFTFLRYGLYTASYISIFFAIISSSLYGYLLTAGVSTEIIRQSLKLYNLLTIPFTAACYRNSAKEIGSYYHHRAKIGRCITKLFSSIAYTAITFAWCFAGSGPLILAFYLCLYITTYSVKKVICHFIDHYMLKQTHHALEKFYTSGGQAILDNDVEKQLSILNKLLRDVYYYSGAELFFAKGNELKRLLAESIDNYIIKSARSNIETLLEMNPKLYHRVERPAEYITSFWAQPSIKGNSDDLTLTTPDVPESDHTNAVPPALTQ